MDITYSARLPEGASDVLIPGGMTTPHGSTVLQLGPQMRELSEAGTGQRAYSVRPGGEEITLTFRAGPARGPYPDAVFVPRQTPFTRYAADLVEEIDGIRAGRTGDALARAIACHAADRFTYGHPEQSFNDGLEVIPALGCGMAVGSCVDINTYFIAALRSAGIEAGYVTGFFFPQEKNGTCEDGHCWVVTRVGGKVQEWDIAHHLKLGTRDIQPGLNPKPGRRMACFHSMGLDFPDLGVTGLKALIEPLALVDGRITKFERPEIALRETAAT